MSSSSQLPSIAIGVFPRRVPFWEYPCTSKLGSYVIEASVVFALVLEVLAFVVLVLLIRIVILVLFVLVLVFFGVPRLVLFVLFRAIAFSVAVSAQSDYLLHSQLCFDCAATIWRRPSLRWRRFAFNNTCRDGGMFGR